MHADILYTSSLTLDYYSHRLSKFSHSLNYDQQTKLIPNDKIMIFTITNIEFIFLVYSNQYKSYKIRKEINNEMRLKVNNNLISVF